MIKTSKCPINASFRVQSEQIIMQIKHPVLIHDEETKSHSQYLRTTNCKYIQYTIEYETRGCISESIK